MPGSTIDVRGGSAIFPYSKSIKEFSKEKGEKRSSKWQIPWVAKTNEPFSNTSKILPQIPLIQPQSHKMKKVIVVLCVCTLVRVRERSWKS